MRKQNIFLFIVVALMLFSAQSCGLYSFTGASIAPNVKTVSVIYFTNEAPKINPQLSQQFTDALRNKLIRETNLSMVTKNGDLKFSGSITDYTITAIGRQGNQAAGNQLSVTVKVQFENLKNEKENWIKSFTQIATFDANQSFQSIESTLVEQINKALADDIFNKALANW